MEDEAELGSLDLAGWSWLSGARWIAEQFPSFRRRSLAVRTGVAARVARHDPTLADELATGLGLLLSSMPLQAQVEVRDRVIALSEVARVPEFALLEFAVVLLDATSRRCSPNPLVFAADHMGWRRIPEAYADTAAELFMLSWAWFNQTSSYWVHDEEERRGLESLGAAVERLAEASAGQQWRRAVRNWGAKQAAVGINATRGAKPILDTLERFPPTSLGGLALYEALADMETGNTRRSIERAAAVLTRRSARENADANRRLRAALRWVGEDLTEAGLLAQGVFDDLVRSGNRCGGAVAAAIIGLSRLESNAASATRWFDLVLRDADDTGNAEFHFGLLCVAASVRKTLGDEVGVRRCHQSAAELAARDPEIAEMFSTWSHTSLSEEELAELLADIRRRRREPPCSLPAPYDDVQLSLARGHVARAYALFGGYVGQLIESHDREAALQRLDLHIRWYSSADVVRGWLCAAAAELCGENDHERWCRYKEQQIEAEDATGVAEEIAGTLPNANGFAFIGPEERIEICICEAQRELEEGHRERARFWVAKAKELRCADPPRDPNRDR